MEYSIGIDIGGTKIAAGIVNQAGELIHRITVSTPGSGREDILNCLRETILELTRFSHHHHRLPLVGIGIGTAGQVDFNRGCVRSGTPNIHNWNNVPLRDYLAGCVNLPVWVDNDVNVIALAEKQFGAARQHNHVVCLALGTGVGGGVISDGQLLHGAWGSAAELGHVSVNMNGPACNCGSFGCLELYASGSGIARMMKEKLSASPPVDTEAYYLFQSAPQNITSRKVFEWLKTGDTMAQDVVETMLSALSFAIVNFIHTFNPTVVVLAGGVMEDGGWIRDGVEQRVKKIGLRSLVDPVEIRAAKLGPDAGLIGAAYQCWAYRDRPNSASLI